jgi:hypothetical protein
VETTRFDRVARAFAAQVSRRQAMIALALSALAGASGAGADAAKRKRKRKPRKPLVFNGYDCVDVGLPCRGNSANCCSGICEGKKPKKGKKDRSRCVAHDSGDCPVEQNACAVPGSICGPLGVCSQTTGKACFCASNSGNCAVCQKDAECVALGWEPNSACIISAGCPQTGGTGCAPPGNLS